jgi:hypothetical protein
VTLSIHALTVETFAGVLQSLSAILDKAVEHARTKKFDPNVFVTARLAPDMFPLSMQIQVACDHAKGDSARLAGVEPPRFEDNEKTMDELKARMAKTIDYIKSLNVDAFEGAEKRHIVQPLIDKLVLEADGAHFLRDWSLPHFYFHVVTAYDILRHNGVEIGKRDYLAHVGRLIHERG